MADKRRKRDAERARREAEARKLARKKRRVIGGISAAIVVIVGIVLGITLSGSGTHALQYVSGPSTDPSNLPGILTTQGPWSNNPTDLQARLSADGLPPLSAMEGQALHIHQHLDIFIEGQRVTVPAGIGIASTPSVVFAPIHTHDASGIIHIESPVSRDFSLGEVFDAWGVRFTSTCIGGYCDSADQRLQVFADGKVVTGDPRLLKLTPHEEIVATFGTPAQIPRPYPVRYSFPATY
jgi:hypothetical protein